MAGVAGFEPTLNLLGLMPESKSGALPLGYTPLSFVQVYYSSVFEKIEQKSTKNKKYFQKSRLKAALLINASLHLPWFQIHQQNLCMKTSLLSM